MKTLHERVIYLAGGCFWGIEAYFRQLKGVVDTEVGYANGDSENPSYEDLVAHRANHAETVKVIYDNDIISRKNSRPLVNGRWTCAILKARGDAHEQENNPHTLT